jgi:cytosine/adenosine deaminase-related metal-dependent hydrolase
MSEQQSRTWTLTARWIFPVDAPPLERGTVTVAGERIRAVEAHSQRTPDVDLGDVAVLPGLVNAHTHLDLSGLRGRCPPSPDFTAWLRSVIRHRRETAPAQVQADIDAGIAESLRCGTTLLGDISGQGWSWSPLATATLRAVVFRELLGLSPERAGQAEGDLHDWLSKHTATESCRPGASPHAPYSVRSALFRAAGSVGTPVATHLAESAAELELLEHHRGPFVDFLRDLGVWDPDGLAKGPDDILERLHGPAPTLIVHGNYLSPCAPVPENASLVYCPRTHAAFGHPPHPFRDFLRRGVRVALGTDSLASNPDLDLLAEIRYLHGRHPDLPGATLLRMATLSGAEALGWADETGSLTSGKSADLVAVPLTETTSADPHELFLASSHPVAVVLWRGRWTLGRAGRTPDLGIAP